MRARTLTSIAAKDLRLRTRGWRWAGVATMYVGTLTLVVLAFLLQKYSASAGTSGNPSPALAGVRLFQALAVTQLLLIAFVTPATVAGAISGERQQRTWELLLASDASNGDIVLAKLVAGLAFNLVLICASLPLFCLTFLFGGLTLADGVPAFIVFLATVALLGSLSLMVSSLTTRLSVSFMVSLLISLTLTIGLSLATLYLAAPGQLGVLTLGAVPFQTGNQPSALTPAAQLDPLVALLSALPSDNGGTLLGNTGMVDHAFGLPWRLNWWGVFALLSSAVSLVATFLNVRLARRGHGLRAGADRRFARGTLHPSRSER